MVQVDKKVVSLPDAENLYAQLFLRNKGYVSDELQQKIRTTKLLIAGCGVGSAFAEAAVRMGFEQITLVDGDTVAISNLNRQTFTYADIDTPKVAALGKRLRAINPNLKLTECNGWIIAGNAAQMVAEADLIFDTIDFLDLVAIVALHDEANRLNKPLISGFTGGWGAMACYFAPTGADSCMFRKIFGLPEHGSVENNSYVKHFAHFIERITDVLDPNIVRVLAKTLTFMEDGTPCPAPHVSAGAFGLASLAVTIASRILNGDEVIAAPHMIVASMGDLASGVSCKPILL